MNFLDISSLDELDDRSSGTKYRVQANIGNGEENFILTYGDNNQYTLMNEATHEMVETASIPDPSQIKVYNTNQYGTQSGGYVANSTGNKTARLNGVGSHDQPENHDSLMQHTHTTTTKKLDKATYSSAAEAELELIRSQQWTGVDAKKYVQGLIDSNEITISNELSQKNKYFEGKYLDWYTEFQNVNSTDLAASLSQDVETLKTEFQTVQSQMTEWIGSSSDTAQETIKCILNKFEITMGNIELGLLPASEAIDLLIEALKKMKTADEELQILLGELSAIDAREPARTITVWKRSKTVKKDSDGNPIIQRYQDTIENPEHVRWQGERDAKCREIEEKRKILDEIVLEVETHYYRIKNFQQVIKHFSSYVSASGSNHYRIESQDAVLRYHDDILYDFENFETNPVITDLTDYEVGDIVRFDDTYGTLYKVVEVGNGFIKIIAVDEYGNPLPNVEAVTIWDQREIIPTEGNFKVPDPILPISPRVPPSSPGSPPSNPPSNPPDQPDPEPPKPDPDPEPPKPDPDPIPDPKPDSDPIPEPEPIPPRPIPPIEDDIPHTGIDSMESKDSSKASVGLAALGGMGVGAAGMGLASLLKDKKDKEEKEDSKKEESKEENKVEAPKKETTNQLSEQNTPLNPDSSDNNSSIDNSSNADEQVEQL